MAWVLTCDVRHCSASALEVMPHDSLTDALTELEEKHHGDWTPRMWSEVTLEEAKIFAVRRFKDFRGYEWSK